MHSWFHCCNAHDNQTPPPLLELHNQSNALVDTASQYHKAPLKTPHSHLLDDPVDGLQILVAVESGKLDDVRRILDADEEVFRRKCSTSITPRLSSPRPTLSYSVNASSQSGWAPLHKAVYYGRVDIGYCYHQGRKSKDANCPPTICSGELRD